MNIQALQQALSGQLSNLVQRIRENPLVGIALFLLAALFFKCMTVADVGSWDSMTYHLPFAARLWGIVPHDMYTMEKNYEDSFLGFPVLAEFLQGFFWTITGQIEAANLVCFFSLLAFFGFLRSYFNVPLFLSVIAILAIPMVQIHASSCYVDLPGSIALSVLILMTYRIFTRQDFWNKSTFWLIFISAACAANIKFLHIPMVALCLLIIVVRVLWVKFSEIPEAIARKQWLKKVVPIGLACSVVIFATPIKNLILHQYPFYPVSYGPADILKVDKLERNLLHPNPRSIPKVASIGQLFHFAPQPHGAPNPSPIRHFNDLPPMPALKPLPAYAPALPPPETASVKPSPAVKAPSPIVVLAPPVVVEVPPTKPIPPTNIKPPVALIKSAPPLPPLAREQVIKLEQRALQRAYTESLPGQSRYNFSGYVQAWLYSIFEIGRPWFTWSIDQYTLPLNSATLHMGGFFNLYVIFNLLLLAYLLRFPRQYHHRKAVAIMALLTVILPFMPEAFQLRFYQYWMILLVSFNLIMLARLQPTEKLPRMLRLKPMAIVCSVFLMVVLWATHFSYLFHWPARLHNVVHFGTDFGILARVSTANNVCLVGMQPNTFLYAALFHPPLKYSLKAARTGHDCPDSIPIVYPINEPTAFLKYAE